MSQKVMCATFMRKAFSFIVIMFIAAAAALGGCDTKEDTDSKMMLSNYSDSYEYNITQLYSSGLPNEGGIGKVRRNAFDELFKAGKDAIPTLLKYGLDKRVVKFTIEHSNCSDRLIGEDQNIRIGIICLHLIEAIKTQEQYHSNPEILYPEQWERKGEFKGWAQEEIITHDKAIRDNKERNQKRAYETYLKWWKSVKDKELTKDYTRIVPWVGYLQYVISREYIKDNIDFK